MRSYSSSLNSCHFSRLGPPLQPPRQASLLSFSRLRFLSPSRHHLCSRFCYAHKLNRINVRKNACRFPHSVVQVSAIDEDSADFSSLDHWGGGTAEYVVLSSDGEDSDGDYILSSVTDLDLPSANVSNNEALTMSAHRFGMIGRGRKTHRMRHGVFINLGLITFLTVLLLFADSCAWKIVRLPLAPFYLTCPFFVSLVLASSAGYICVPLLRSLKIHQIIRKEGPILHPKKRSIPTMGGLFFVPVGVAVAKAISGFSSTEVSGAAAATFAFAAIGFLDDILSLKKNHNSGLSAQLKLLLEVAVAICFSFWLDATSISSPYGMYSFL